ncbi:hypothetical protein ACFOQM_12455 [Paenibacillus sp. GCM10012307]|uniref:Phage protein n=1 Tax=Paenibacillus roseus TaxID=2798579 RepID=A0A934J5S9_9BACL|nr:hypothetical protein [Paenibacillus roseus]MBJ6362103.1 hypothetical protein [Paenibacillus roseus]
MSFKDWIAQDNLRVFINPDEFGEPKMIDGVELSVVIDNDLINERNSLSAYGMNNVTAEGVYLSTITFFVRQSDLGYVPKEGERMQYGDVDKKGYSYMIAKVSGADGILEITLEGNQS